MARGDPRDWMWSEALQMLAQAERLHHQVFRPQTAGRLRPSWEPPVDVLETEREVLILAALPGVDVQTGRGRDRERHARPVGRAHGSGRTAHRQDPSHGTAAGPLRAPHRRCRPAVYGEVRRFEVNGCLVVTLAKAGHAEAAMSPQDDVNSSQ